MQESERLKNKSKKESLCEYYRNLSEDSTLKLKIFQTHIKKKKGKIITIKEKTC